jgi:hypothetical protein
VTEKPDLFARCEEPNLAMSTLTVLRSNAYSAIRLQE